MSEGCSAEQQAACPLVRHFTDTHHLFYPRREYRTGIAHRFRELPENKVELCRNEHNERHATEQPPVRPSNEAMREAVVISRLAERAIQQYGQTEMAG